MVNAKFPGLLGATYSHTRKESLRHVDAEADLLNGLRSGVCRVQSRRFHLPLATQVHKMWDLLGVTNSYLLRQLDARVARHDVYGMGRQGAYNRHVAKNTSRRDAMRSTLRDAGRGYRHLQRVRRTLGFPAVGLEGPPPVPLVQHRH